MTTLEIFIERVLQQGYWEEELRNCENTADFARVLISAARSEGLTVEPGDVYRALAERRTEWNRRLL
jgi:hypothetical protein